MEQITIDFTGCKYLYDLHETVQRAMDFPDGYGKNLDALWDFLLGASPTEVHFKGIESLRPELQEQALRIFDVFVEAEQKYGDITALMD